MQLDKRGRALRVGIVCVVALMAGAGWDSGARVVQAQTSTDPAIRKNQVPTMPSVAQPSFDDIAGGPPGPMVARTNEERRKAINDQRHKRLEDDVSKLMALTTELKTEVDQTKQDELSLEVMRKAAEIEKLAHDVQSRMKS